MDLHSADTLESAIPAKRVAIFSDVHGNLPALQAVLADISNTGVDERWCLGDLVGYGAQPNECVALAKESCDLILIGNHDLVVIDKLDIADFSLNAAVAARWTQENIAADAVEFLNTLEPADTTKPIGLFHASPRDPVWEYVLSTMLADACMDANPLRIGAVGHSHVALYFWRQSQGAVAGEHAPGGTHLDLRQGDWIINPGGVGQPRDGDPRAAWLLLDLDNWTAEWRRVEYPIDDAARAIQQAGLPLALSDRLYHGQ
jgi:diadenosine tetraphosphatase ApaH/serine/threonine PP2A family protein phosphatase